MDSDQFDGDPYDPDWEPDESPFGGEYEEEDNDLDDSDKDEDFGETIEELMSHFEAETDEFNEAEAEFVATYGFVHKCRCAQDWEEGNLGVVSVCYLGMVNDAMERLSGMVVELKDAKRELAQLRIDTAAG